MQMAVSTNNDILGWLCLRLLVGVSCPGLALTHHKPDNYGQDNDQQKKLRHLLSAFQFQNLPCLAIRQTISVKRRT
jgi:hypothetical protein